MKMPRPGWLSGIFCALNAFTFGREVAEAPPEVG